MSKKSSNLSVNNNINDSKNSKIDSSEISDIDENGAITDAFDEYDNKKDTINDNNDNEFNNNTIAMEAREEYIKTTVTDNVIKFLKIDNILKKKQDEYKEEIKPIKEAKNKLENFLIDYLDNIKEDYFQIGKNDTLMKTVISTKSAIKIEDIASEILNGFEKYELFESHEEAERVMGEFIKQIDAKREIKTRKYLKKMKVKEEKNKNINKNIKGNKENKEKKKKTHVVKKNT